MVGISLTHNKYYRSLFGVLQCLHISQAIFDESPLQHVHQCLLPNKHRSALCISPVVDPWS